MTAYQTMLLQLLEELKILVNGNLKDEPEQVLEDLIDRLECHLDAAPEEPSPDLGALSTEVTEAVKALIAAIGTYLQALKEAAPEQQRSALEHLHRCVTRVNATLSALEMAPRPRTPRPW